jgi:hypothetical protein
VAWASTVSDKSRPPIITLHPSLLGGSEKEDPWHISPHFLGPALAFDTILHECIHIHITHNLGGQDGPTSHNCRRWIRQVNRIAPLLGLKGIHVGMSKTMRVPVEPPQYTARGNRVTRVVRRCAGAVPFRVGSGFPQAARTYLGQTPGKNWGPAYKSIFVCSPKGFEMGEDRQFKQRVFKFVEKPEAHVLAALKEHGFTYRPNEKAWTVNATAENRVLTDRLAREFAGMDLGVSR